MSVVVRMDMPDKCGKCPLAWYDGAGPCFCMVSLERNDAVDDGMMWKEADPNKKPSWCPIICQLPEGHGRLVDAEKLKAKKYHSDITHENAVAVAEIDWAETIIPADTAESPSPKPTDPVPIRDVYYVMTECDVKTGTVTYELRERSET